MRINYKTYSLIPICGKVIKKLISNSLSNYVDGNKLSAHQSGFHNNESCVNPLLAIIHEIYIVFDNNLTLEMRRVFTTSQRLLTKYDMLD